MIFYFSGCGDSRWVAEELGDRLHQELKHIPDELHTDCSYQVQSGEPIGFVFPTHAWRPPKIVREFIDKLHLQLADGKETYVFMVTTCGDNIGHADKWLERLIGKHGLSLSATYSIIMPETYINLPGFHTDTAQTRNQKLALARTTLPILASALKHQDKECNVTRGNLPFLKSNVLGWLFEALLISDKPFRTTAQCTGCGKCAKVCPLHNITLTNARPSWNGHCTNCMACYHYCPTHAVQWGGGTKRKGQYHHPEYT